MADAANRGFYVAINSDSDRKRAWSVPTAEVFASQSDVAAKIGIDVDEDFTGTPS